MLEPINDSDNYISKGKDDSIFETEKTKEKTSLEKALELLNMTEEEKINVWGARVHNLKNIDVEIPRDSLTVITGLSGSGKSSLAFDTIFAEGQRRYIETFSAYARNFLGNMERPDVDKITGLSPVISIEQKTTNKNPRSPPFEWGSYPAMRGSGSNLLPAFPHRYKSSIPVWQERCRLSAQMMMSDSLTYIMSAAGVLIISSSPLPTAKEYTSPQTVTE